MEQEQSAVTKFDRFWSCYPRKVGKGAAAKAWDKINPEEPLFTQIILAVDAQQRHRHRLEQQNKTVTNERYKKFIPDWPHPATWLNQQRWLDELTSVTETKQEIREKEVCPECSKEHKQIEEFPHFQNPEHLCSWHYSKKHYSGGPTGLNALREVFIRLGLQQQQGETREAWIARLKSIARIKAKTLGQVQRKGTGEHQPVPENIQRQSNVGQK